MNKLFNRTSTFIKRTFSNVQVNHTLDNNNTTSRVFNFTKENSQKIKDILQKYPTNYKKSAVIPALFIAQEQNNNFLTLGAMNKVAEILEMPQSEVYEVASFYTMFNRVQLGKFHLQICGTTPCMVCGSESIIKAIEDYLGIKMGETTKDNLFTMTEVECLGACSNAPMLQINNKEVYEDLTPENVITLLQKLKNGEEIKAGPQIKRNRSEGPLKRSSLLDKEWVNSSDHKISRNFKKAKLEWDKAKEDAAKEAAAKAAAPPQQATKK